MTGTRSRDKYVYIYMCVCIHINMHIYFLTSPLICTCMGLKTFQEIFNTE